MGLEPVYEQPEYPPVRDEGMLSAVIDSNIDLEESYEEIIDDVDDYVVSADEIIDDVYDVVVPAEEIMDDVHDDVVSAEEIIDDEYDDVVPAYQYVLWHKMSGHQLRNSSKRCSCDHLIV